MFNINQVQQKYIGQNILGLVSNYKVQRVIGSGTAGCVCVGMDNMKNIPVAIKMQLYMSNHELVICQQFTNKNMTNLINIQDVFKLDNVVFIIMEYANGGSLTEYLNKLGQKISMQIIDNIIKQIANGVLELHNNQMIHRDIKMDNIVICTINNVDYFKLCDYGLARQLVENQQPQTNNIGTPTHMAPELIGDLKPYNNKVDIWALACLWYNLITKSVLFPGKSIQEVFTQIQQATDASIAKSIEMLKLPPVREELLISMLKINYMLRPSIKEVITQLQPTATLRNLDKLKMLKVSNLKVPVLAVDKKQNIEKRINLQLELDIKRQKEQIEIKMAKYQQEKLNQCVLKYREARNNGDAMRLSKIMKETEEKEIADLLKLQMEQEIKVINQQVDEEKQREITIIRRDLENQYKLQLEQELHQLRQEQGKQYQAQYESPGNDQEYEAVLELQSQVESAKQECDNYKQQLEYEKQQNAILLAENHQKDQLIEQQRLEIIQLNNKLQLQQQQQFQQPTNQEQVPKHNQLKILPGPQQQLQPLQQQQPLVQQKAISLIKLHTPQPNNNLNQNMVANLNGDKQIQLQLIKARPKIKEPTLNQIKLVIKDYQGQDQKQLGDKIRQIVMECYNTAIGQPILSL